MSEVICCTEHTDYTVESLSLAVASLPEGWLDDRLDELIESLTLPVTTRNPNLRWIAELCDANSGRDVTHCRCECCQRVMERPRSECCQSCVDEWTENRAAEERPRG